jgi:hypothetical protein
MLLSLYRYATRGRVQTEKSEWEDWRDPDFEVAVGLYKFHSVYPQRSSTLFQPLNRKCGDILITKFAFDCHMYRYIAAQARWGSARWNQVDP